MIVNLNKRAMLVLIIIQAPSEELRTKEPIKSYGDQHPYTWVWSHHKLDALTEEKLWEIYLLMNPPKTPAGNWVAERSSGFNGFRCTVCGNWIYDNEEKKCQCD